MFQYRNVVKFSNLKAYFFIVLCNILILVLEKNLFFVLREKLGISNIFKKNTIVIRFYISTYLKFFGLKKSFIHLYVRIKLFS